MGGDLSRPYDEPLPLTITFDQATYDAERRRRLEICAAAGHRLLGRKCVRCLDIV